MTQKWNMTPKMKKIPKIRMRMTTKISIFPEVKKALKIGLP